MNEKKLLIAESIISTATAITNGFKGYPSKNKYWFKRSYKRGLSIQNREKRALIVAKTIINATMGAMQIRQIISTPIPKFQKGSNG